MINLKHYPIKEYFLNKLDVTHNNDFKGVWSINKDLSVNIDVFDLYNVGNGDYIVVEDENFRCSGNFDECINYIHSWL